MDYDSLVSFFKSRNSLSTIQKKKVNGLECYSINNSSYLSLLQLQGFFLSTFNLKIEKDLLKQLLDNYSKENKVTEKSVQIRLAKLLNGEMEVKAGDSGRIDILTADEIIEVKPVNLFKGAVGQLLFYKDYFEGRQLRLHIYGKPIKNFLEIYEVCQKNNIKLTYEST